MATQVPTQLVLYSNDAVDVSYSDGSRLQLSPCAASFVWLGPPTAGQHPLQGTDRVQQRTQYVTSAFRRQVTEAIDFRNRFAERPFLFAGLVEPHKVLKLHAHITEVVWPSTATGAIVEMLSDGSRRLQSNDKFATVTLSPCGQMFTFEYLAKTSQPLPKAPKAVSHVTTSHEGAGADCTATTSVGDNTKSTTFGPLSTITPCSDMRDHVGQIQEYTTDGSRSTLNCTLEDYDSTKHTSSVSKSALVPQNCQGASLTEYTWVVQHFSVMEFPTELMHPVKMLQDYDSKVVRIQEKSSNGLCEVQTNPKCAAESSKKANNSGDKKGKQKEDKGVVCKLKESLPLKCSAQHLHKWLSRSTEGEECTYNGKLKVLCSKGIIYKLKWAAQKCVEVNPGDGSIMRSNGIAGHYFTHYLIKENKLEEKTYSLLHPPPKVVGEPYPKGLIVQKAARLLELIFATDSQASSSAEVCCWRAKPAKKIIEPLSSILLESSSYAGLGRFTAYSNGRVRVTFEDRTNLDMQANFSGRIGQCLKHSDDPTSGDANEEIDLSRRPVAPNDIPQGLCRLLLPNGQYKFVSVNNPGSYSQYVQSALEWATWVNTSPSERHMFYRGTLHDPEKRASVNQELSRINCFNYLLDNKVMPDLQKTDPRRTGNCPVSSYSNLGCQTSQPSHKYSLDTNLNPNCYDPDLIKNVLQRNSQAVKDLDDFLNVN